MKAANAVEAEAEATLVLYLTNAQLCARVDQRSALIGSRMQTVSTSIRQFS